MEGLGSPEREGEEHRVRLAGESRNTEGITTAARARAAIITMCETAKGSIGCVTVISAFVLFRRHGF